MTVSSPNRVACLYSRIRLAEPSHRARGSSDGSGKKDPKESLLIRTCHGQTGFDGGNGRRERVRKGQGGSSDAHRSGYY